MASREYQYFIKMREFGLCAYCGQPFHDSGPVGTGRLADGAFCSLLCLGRYHEMALTDKARLFARAARGHNGEF